MKVLVVGACGFLGTHVSRYFKQLGHEVVAVDNLTLDEFNASGYKNGEARMYNYNLLKNLGIETQVADITLEPYVHIIEKQEFDYIVNCAAQPTMTLSIRNPVRDLEVNVLGAVNLLEIARKRDIPIALCSSVHVYGNGINRKLIEKETRFIAVDSDSIDENTEILTGDISPLHASKRAMELYGQCYIDTYGLDVGIFRLTGMYGPYQFAGMHHGWVSNFIIRVLKGLPVYIFGTDKQVRDILYADDAAHLFSCFYDFSHNSGIYNIGGGLDNSISLGETLSFIEKVTNKKANIIMKPHRFGDMYYFVCDISRADEKLHWIPSVDPFGGLSNTIDWIRENIDLFGGMT